MRTWVFAAGIFLLLLLVDLFVFIIHYPAFNRELRYLNIEIGRAEEDDRLYLKRRKRRLILSAILFSKF